MKAYLRFLTVAAVACLAATWSLGSQPAASAVTMADDDDQVQALVTVYDEVLGTLHDRLFGTNMIGAENYGDNGGGLWDPQGAPCAGDIVGCYNPSSYSMLVNTKPGLVRFPGGRMTRSYLWEDGIGPAEGREYLFGTDEFLFTSKNLGTVPMITVSLYDPETGAFASSQALDLAAAWVDYVKNESPYGPVIYWEVDQDTWENTANPDNPDIQYKRVPPEAYAAAFLEMSIRLKEIDPTIRVGAVSYENSDILNTYHFLEQIADSGADPMYWPDFLSMNFYRPNFDKNRCDLYGLDLQEEISTIMAATFAASQELNQRISDVLHAIETYWGGYKGMVPVFISDYNTQLLFADRYTNSPDPEPAECPFKNLSHSLGAAIFNADVLMTLFPYADNLLGAASWNFMDYDQELKDYYGSVYLYENRGVARPNELVLKMLGENFRVDDIYETQVVSSTFDNEAVSRTPSYKSITIGPDEHYIRVRLVRFREPVENSPVCGPDNAYNPEPDSYINGAYLADSFSLTQDGLPPALTEELLTNGDFEQPLNVGWQTNPDPTGVTTSRICEGENCYVKVQFSNTPDNNPQYLSQLMQTVEVTPGYRYRLEYAYRAQDLQVKTQNLLCDPSWEFTSTPGPFNNSFWVQWSSTPAPATIIDTDCMDGNQCVQVPIVDNPEYYHIRQEYPLVNSTFPELADPDTYRIKGWIKTDNLDGPVTVEAQFRDINDNLIYGIESFGVFGTTDWWPQDFRVQTAYREATTFVSVHLRRKWGYKDNGQAFFDNIRMYRDELVYAPRVIVDICQDAGCVNKRSVMTDGKMGTLPWSTQRIAGTPLISAMVGKRGDNFNIILINKDQDQTINAMIDLTALNIEGERLIYKGSLSGESVDSNNELVNDVPDISVFMTGGSYFGTFDGTTFTIQLPPFSITGLKLVDPNLVDDNPDPVNDDTADDDSIIDDDTGPDDDVTPDDDTGDDDNDDNDEGGGGEEGCGC